MIRLSTSAGQSAVFGLSVESIRERLEIACKTASRSVSYLGSKGMIDLNTDK